MAADGHRSDNAVQKILDGTMKALSRQGTHKLSVSDICEASEVARGTFYRYFNTKEEVLALLARHFEEGVAQLFELASRPDRHLTGAAARDDLKVGELDLEGDGAAASAGALAVIPYLVDDLAKRVPRGFVGE